MPKEEKNKISHRSRALAMVGAHFVEAGYRFHTDGELESYQSFRRKRLLKYPWFRGFIADKCSRFND